MADLFIIRERLKFSMKLCAVGTLLGLFATWYFWSQLEFETDRSRFLLSAVITGGLALATAGVALFYLAAKRVVNPSNNMTDRIDGLPWWLVKVVLLILCIGAMGFFIDRFAKQNKSEFDLVRRDELVDLKERLEANPDVLEHKESRAGMTLVQIAYRENHPDALALLLSLGANSDEMDALGRNPVIASLENIPMLNCLLEAGLNPDGMDAEGIPALHYAVVLKSEPILSALLEAGAKIDARDKLFRTPLLVAMENDDNETMKLLLEKGASVNEFDRRGDTALHKAARRRNEESIRLLLEYGGDPRIFNFSQMTPLHIVAEGGHNKIVSLFLELPDMTGLRSEADQTPLDCALRSKKYDTAELLIASGEDVNRILANGDTLLHTTVLNRDYSTARFLIRTGADASIENAKGETAYSIMRRKQLSGLIDLVDGKESPDSATNNVESAETL